jgi:SulP family sulfate permease
VSWTTVAFSAVTIVALVGLRRIAPRIPGPLVAVVGGIVLVAVTSIEATVSR